MSESASTPSTNPSGCDLLITDATLLDGSQASVAIAGARIVAVGSHDDVVQRVGRAVCAIDAAGKLLAPARCNAHTHASMTLFRGAADDLALMDWLTNHIWPAEAKLTADDCYWGAKLACLEMIRTGTTFLSDMYWHMPDVARAVRDTGIRAAVCAVFVKFVEAPFQQMAVEALGRFKAGEFGDRVQFWLGPHAPHTVRREDLEWCAAFSAEHDVGVHIHLAETMDEVRELKEQVDLSPGRYLDACGIVTNKLLAAHCVWLDDDELARFGEAGATIAHCPVSNMKLASGGAEARAFPYVRARKAGVNVAIGTDGAASNNSLDVIGDTRVAAVLAKHASGDPTSMPAAEALDAASAHGFKAFGLDAGRVAEGALADLILLPLDELALTPAHCLESHLVYAASGHLVDTTICAGQVLMENRRFDESIVGDVAEVRAKVAEAAARVCAKA